MDRRSWLWRRKSSEKSPGETESSGSISSHSERFSDDPAPNHNTQSPEVTSKDAPCDEEVDDTERTLAERFSAALLNIRVKEELVKQHVKVAEEAVSGWERSEKEVLTLRQQLEDVTQKNLLLEDRVSHLDGALKECLRQLRQVREEQEQNFQEAVSKKTSEWEFIKSELESQLVELRLQLQTAKADAFTSIDPDLRTKLETAMTENSALKLELLARAKELEIRTTERDLTTQAAETASKQHLDSIKKVTKLESECRRLKAVAHKALPAKNHRFATTSFTDSLSDSGERLMVIETDTPNLSGSEPHLGEKSNSDSRGSALIAELDQFKIEKALGGNLAVPSVDINIMDDFLEMEKLALLLEIENGSCHENDTVSNEFHGQENSLRAELEAMINRTAELEERLEKMEMQKVVLEMSLSECQVQLNVSRYRLEESEAKLMDLQSQLYLANEARRMTEAEIDITNAKLQMTGVQLQEAEAKLLDLQTRLSIVHKGKKAADVELDATNAKIETLRSCLHEAEVRLMELQTELRKANEARRVAEELSEATDAKLWTSKSCFEEAEMRLIELQAELGKANEARRVAEIDAEATSLQKEAVESRLSAVEAELNVSLSRIGSLEIEIQKEQALFDKTTKKCRKLEDEILRMKSEKELSKSASSSENFKIKQEKELALAASKFADCQKTIASLGRQLKSLATLEDFLNDSDKLFEVNKNGLECP